MKKISLISVFLMPLVLAVSSCKDPLTNPDVVINVVFPDSNVSYSQHVDALFQQGCIFSHCHGSASAGGLNLASPSYSQLMNHQPRLVVSGASNNSLLIQRLDGRVQPQMPLTATKLNENQIKGIARWIDEGAVNN